MENTKLRKGNRFSYHIGGTVIDFVGSSNGSFNYFYEAHALQAIFINENIQGLELPDLIRIESF